ncbi:MAG TPA: penicillin-binding protein [Candidatus Binatia bacterium]|jgi:cell division protein FtsI (penicillin-binding protein 3)
MRSRNRFSSSLALIGVLCACGGVTLIGRMYQLQVVRGDHYRALSESTKCKDTIEIAYRGPIVDRNGVVLATTTSAAKVSRGGGYHYEPTHAGILAPLLKVDRASLDARLAKGGESFTWLSRGVDQDVSTAIQNLRIPGIEIHQSQERSYPQGSTAAHVIGFTGADADGLEGVEQRFDKEIKGSSVKVHVCRDVTGRAFLSDSEDTGLNRGGTAYLTIDATLQSIVEAELSKQVKKTQAVAGAAVMLDPKTGEILALANVPTYDPNDVDDSPIEARRDRVVTDLFEPGSTMKPFVVSSALELGLVKPEDKFFCENGNLFVPGWPKPIRDHHPYGWLDVASIIRVSSNIGAAKIGWQLGPQREYQMLNAFGFDRPSHVELPGERRGMVLPPDKWKQLNTTTISFGQGISVTPIQLATAYATLANDGVRMQPHIIRKITDQYGQVTRDFPLEEERRVVSVDVAREMRHMLAAVVSKDGTAAAAAVDGVPAAGKTGTAQKAENGHYSDTRWLATFAGFLPVENPRVVIVVMIDEPRGVHFGGLVSAPVFKAIAESSLDYLGIERELPPPSSKELDKLFEGSDEPDLQEAAVDPESVPAATASGAMPDLRGLPLRAAMRALASCDCDVKVEGHGFVVSHQPAPGSTLGPQSSVSLKLAATL